MNFFGHRLITVTALTQVFPAEIRINDVIMDLNISGHPASARSKTRAGGRLTDRCPAVNFRFVTDDDALRRKTILLGFVSVNFNHFRPHHRNNR